MSATLLLILALAVPSMAVAGTARPTTDDHGGAQVADASKSDQTITFEPMVDHAFGDPPFEVEATASSGLPVTLSALGSCRVSGLTVSFTGAGVCSLTASQAGDGEWNPAPKVFRSFAVDKGDQTITFDSISDHAFGDQPFEVTAVSSSGLLVSLFAYEGCSVSGIAVTLRAVGRCTVTAMQYGNSNWYAAPDVERSFRISKGAQSVNVSLPATVSYGSGPYPITAIASSGLDVDITAVGPCTVLNGNLIASGAGTCVLTATQRGDKSWVPETTQLEVAIVPATARIVASDRSVVSDGEPKAISVTTEPAGLPVEVLYEGSIYPPSEPGTYEVVVKVLDPDYSARPAHLTLTIVDGTGLPANVMHQRRPDARYEVDFYFFIVLVSLLGAGLLIRAARKSLREPL
jgi:hypothetical protein